MKKFKSLSAFILTAVMIFSIQINPVAAISSEGKEKNDASASLYMQELCDEANEKYNILLQEWTKEDNDKEEIVYPDYYGGTYFDEDGSLVLCVTDIKDEIKEDLSRLIDLKNVKFKLVKYPYSQLCAEKKILSNALLFNRKNSDLDTEDIVAVGISNKNNAVIIYSKAAKKNSDIEKAFPEYENIEYRLNSKPITPCSAVEPGTAISNRSAGFWAYDSNGNLGIVTSPHTTITSGMSIAINGVTFGNASQPYCGGTTDAVFVRRTNTMFTPTRYVSGWEFNLKSTSTITLAENSYIYKKGTATGCTLGTIVDNQYDFSWTQNGILKQFENCVLTTANTDGGDSGGIVAGGGSSSSRYVAGIVIAMNGATGPAPMIYCSANNIKYVLGVSVY